MTLICELPTNQRDGDSSDWEGKNYGEAVTSDILSDG